MKKISRIQASKRILQIAKAVAQVQASNTKLTPLEIAKVQKTVAMILASANIDNDTLEQIQSLEQQDDGNSVNVNQGVKQLLKNKQQLNMIKNQPLKSQPSVKQYLKENGIMVTKQMKVGKFFEIIKNLLINYETIVNQDEQIGY